MKLINIFCILTLNSYPKLLSGIQGLSSSIINYYDGLINYPRKWEMDDHFQGECLKLPTRCTLANLSVLQPQIFKTVEKLIVRVNYSLSHDMVWGSSKPRWNYHSTLGVIDNTLHPFSKNQNLNISSSPRRSFSFFNQEILEGNITKISGYRKFFMDKNSTLVKSSKSECFSNKVLDQNSNNSTLLSHPNHSKTLYRKNSYYLKVPNQRIEENQSKRRKFVTSGIFKNISRQPKNKQIDKTPENVKRKKMILEMNLLLMWYHLNDFMTGRNVRIQEFYDPKTVSNDKATEAGVSTQLWCIIWITICTIGTIRFKLYSKLPKFKESTWQTLNVCQIIMEMVANRKSMNLYKRIIFGFLLITSIVYVSYFYSNIKTIEHLVSTSVSRTFSPYIDRFNEIIPKVSTLNIVKYTHRIGEYLKIVNLSLKVITKDELPLVLFCVLAVGYSLSIIVFLLEVIAAKLMRSSKSQMLKIKKCCSTGSK